MTERVLPFNRGGRSCRICGDPHRARGLCKHHWQQWRKTADPHEVRQRAYPSLQAAFDSARKNSAANGCLIWCGKHAGYEPRLYGQLSFGGRTIGAHVAAYELQHGTVPKGYEVDHTCQVTLCVNVNHLRLATRKQNQEHRQSANTNSLTGARGITYDKSRNQYRARLKHHGKEIHIGRFATLDQADAAVKAKRTELFSHNDQDRLVS